MTKATDYGPSNVITEPPPRRCSQGHVLGGWPIWLRVGKHEFCMTCIEEKLPALLDWFGIGRILPEEAQDDHHM